MSRRSVICVYSTSTKLDVRFAAVPEVSRDADTLLKAVLHVALQAVPSLGAALVSLELGMLPAGVMTRLLLCCPNPIWLFWYLG